MTDLTTWAPLATAIAALVAAGVNLLLGSNRQQRLKMAVEVADKLSEAQRGQWALMIHRDAARIMERAERPRWLLWVITLSWAMLVAALWTSGAARSSLLWVSNGLAAVYLVTALLYARAEKRHIKSFIAGRESEAALAASEARGRAQRAYFVWLLMSQGASKRDAHEAVSRIDDLDTGVDADKQWVAWAMGRKGSLAWRVRRVTFRKPAPPYAPPRREKA